MAATYVYCRYCLATTAFFKARSHGGKNLAEKVKKNEKTQGALTKTVENVLIWVTKNGRRKLGQKRCGAKTAPNIAENIWRLLAPWKRTADRQTV